MLYKIISLLILLVSFSIISCKDDEFTIRLQGQVVNETDNSPIADATVKLYKGYESQFAFLTRTESDDDGNFNISYTYDNKYDCQPMYFEVIKQGYLTRSFSPISPYNQINIHCKENLQVYELPIKKE